MRHQSFGLINVVEKTPEQPAGVFSVFKLYIIYKVSYHNVSSRKSAERQRLIKLISIRTVGGIMSAKRRRE